MRHPVRPFKAVLLATSLAACAGSDDAATAAWQTVTDTIADTVVVRTVGADDSAAALRLVEELRIGQFEGEEEYGFGGVEDVLPAHDGGAYVWDATLGTLRQYSADGRFVRQIGRQGSGPGEYKRADGLARLPDGRIALWDAGNTRITLYDTTGAAAGEIRASSTLFGNDALVADTTGRLYLLAQLQAFDDARPDAPRRRGYVVYDEGGQVVDSLALPPEPDFAGLEVVRRVGEGVARTRYVVPYTPYSIRVLGPHGHVVSAEGDRYALTVHRAGAPLLRIEREVAPVPVDGDEQANQTEILTAIIRRRNPGWRWDGPPVPATKPLIRNVEVGGDGRLWVLRSLASERIEDVERAERPDAPPPRRWRDRIAYDVYEPDGRLLGHLPMPRRTSLHHMHGDRVWGVVTDSLDVPYVVRFRLERGAPDP